MTKNILQLKKVIHLAMVLCFISLFCFSVTDRDLEKDAVKITGEAFIKNNTCQIIRMLSDEIGPRVTGTESAHRAARLCLDLFRKYGLSNVHLEYFTYRGWLPGTASAEAVEPFYKSLRVVSLARSINTAPEGLIADVIDVGNGTEDDFQIKDKVIKNKIVLAGLKEPFDKKRKIKPLENVEYAAKYGALGCIIITPTKGAIPKVRRASNEKYSPIPAAAITQEDGSWIRRMIEVGKPVKMKLIINNKIHSRLQAENVVAEIKGKEKPEEIVLLGAHLDTWNSGTGATDNALGCAIALETARILNILPEKPRRTVRFVLFTGEEEGLVGSWEYVKKHESELDNIILMVNLDMTGLLYPGILNPYGGCKFKEKLEPLMKLLEGFGITQIESKYPYDSDDFNFVAKGVPALGLQGRGVRDWSWAHGYADTFDKIEIDKVNMTTSAIAITINYAANKEGTFAKRLSQEEVIRFFKEKNLDIRLKKEKTWKKLGFPDEDKSEE